MKKKKIKKYITLPFTVHFKVFDAKINTSVHTIDKKENQKQGYPQFHVFSTFW